MGADAFVAYFGLKYTLPPDADVTELEEMSDARVVTARRAGLDTCWGRLTDGEYYYLLIGAELGVFGVEGIQDLSLSHDDVSRTAEKTAAKLKAAGFSDAPAFHFQLDAQY